MNLEWIGKPFRKKPIQKSKKTVKISEIAACEQKTLPRKRTFVQTPFAHSNSQLERKNFTQQNHLLVRSTSCLGDQNCYSIDFKNHENV